MLPEFRKEFNDIFSQTRYQALLKRIEEDFPDQLDFRVAETPVFVGSSFKEKLISACDQIISVVKQPDFLKATGRSIPFHQYVPGENGHTSFLAIDFAVCKNEAGEPEPRLIELQGFPSVFGYQLYLSELFREFYGLSNKLTYSFIRDNGEKEAYLKKMSEVLVAGENPEHVILLDIFPEKQKTRIDFAITEKFWGITPVCITKLSKDGRKLFYEKNGKYIPVKRIYNRLIFDELNSYPDLHTQFKLTDEADVTWAGHPNWFFRISKFMLPLLSGKYFPRTRFLSDYNREFPQDLENYVLKPLFSFAGSGVTIDVTSDKLYNIPDPENYILQEKVSYEPLIRSADGAGVKAEIRMMYVWPDEAKAPQLLTALSRLTRGEMIGVRYNNDYSWVGSSAVFFER